MPSNRRLAAIMFTDIVGYTSMMQKDETNGFIRVKRYRQVLSERVDAHGGQVKQHYGDGSLSIFSSAVEAVACAKEVQEILKEDPKVLLRTGIHIGDIILEGEDIFGDGVNLASRVESMAAPGAILITDRVIQDIRNHPEFQTVSLGQFSFHNVQQPMEVYALSNQGFPIPSHAQLRLKLGEAVLTQSGKKKFTRWKKRWVIPGMLLLAVLIGFLIRTYLPFDKDPQEFAATLGGPSIAVLPFTDLSPQGDQSFFGDGMSEEILNALTHVEGLKVAGRTSSFSFRESELDLREIGKKLGVGAILEGSVRKAGEEVRITAQLINTADGFHLWSETYDRQISDIFAVQEDIANTVAEKLVGILMENRTKTIVKKATENEEAYEKYLQGRYLLSQRSDGAEKALTFFEEAIELDPQFSLAYAGLANGYLWLGWGNYIPSREAFPQARKYALEALKYDSTLAYAHSMLGAVKLWYDWEWENARTSLERAITLNPSESSAYLDLGWYYAVSGNFEEAVNQISEAVTLDPLNLEYNIDLADILRMDRQYDKAREIASGMQELYPNNSETFWILGLIDFTEGKYKSALKNFDRSVEYSNSDPWALIHKSMALAKAGQEEKAREILNKVLRDKKQLEASPVELALTYMSLGNKDKALELLENSYKIHANWLISVEMDPIWNVLKNEARYQTVIEKMAFPN